MARLVSSLSRGRFEGSLGPCVVRAVGRSAGAVRWYAKELSVRRFRGCGKPGGRSAAPSAVQAKKGACFELAHVGHMADPGVSAGAETVLLALVRTKCVQTMLAAVPYLDMRGGSHARKPCSLDATRQWRGARRSSVAAHSTTARGSGASMLAEAVTSRSVRTPAGRIVAPPGPRRADVNPSPRSAGTGEPDDRGRGQEGHPVTDT